MEKISEEQYPGQTVISVTITWSVNCRTGQQSVIRQKRFLKAQHTLQIQASDNAGVLAAKAALDNAQLNLSYT